MTVAELKPQPQRVQAQAVQVSVGWHQDRTTTPDLMQIFQLVLANLYRSSVDTSLRLVVHEPEPVGPGMAEGDVEALMDWLRSDSLDWDAVERARDEGWR